MIYEREYWHYQRADNPDHEPYAIQLYRTVDTHDRPHLQFTALIYCETLDTTGRLIVESDYGMFSVEGYAGKIWKEAAKHGVKFSDEEYYQLVTFIVDVLNDRRKVRESEILK